ncbi:MAG: hypothetical protein ACP5M4_15980, partial [Acidobacteriaceae bacterium]
LQVRRSLEHWQKRIMGTDLAEVRRLATEIPSEWYRPELVDSTIESLQARRQKLGSLFREAEAIILDHHSSESKEFVNSLDPHVSLTPEEESLTSAE